MTESQLRVGHIPYLNCRPFFHYLRECGFDGEIVSGVPSALNRMLQDGRIDISPSSSFEYALNAADYLLLPQLSISSNGAVKSVLLFSPCAPAELEGRKIAITGESATSINLLRVLLREYYGLERVADFVPPQPVEELISTGQPALLIGDRAMSQAENLPPGMACYDLGQLWLEQTGLPFVFALWILRRDSAVLKSEAIGQLSEQLDRAMVKAFADLDALSSGDEVGRAKHVAYWQTIDYRLEEKHLQGLQLFFRLCRKHGLLNEEPALEFFAG